MTNNPRPTDLIYKWLLALTLALGAGIVWTTVGIWILATAFGGARGVYESLVFTPEGEVYIQTNDVRNYQIRDFRRLDGEPVRPGDITWLAGANAAAAPAKRRPPVDDWSHRLAPFTDAETRPVYWYFIFRDGGGYFVGFDSVSNRKVGYLGAEGVVGSTPRQLFAVPLDKSNHWSTVIATSQLSYSYGEVREPQYFGTAPNAVFPAWRVYLIDGDRLLEVDLRQRDRPPRVLLEHEGLLSVALHSGYQPALTFDEEAPADQQPPAAEPRRQRDVLVLSTREDVIVYDPIARQAQVYARPDELIGKAVTVYRPLGGGLILQHTSYDTTREKWPVVVYHLAADGTLEQSREVQLRRGDTASGSLVAVGMAAAAPAPLAAVAATLAAAANQAQFDPELSFRQALQRTWAEMWPYPAVTLLISIGLSFACYRRQRRFAERAFLRWMVLILLLGVPGYLGYLLHRRWPLRPLCPNCNMPTPRDREACVDCGAQWPRPEPQGVEVYA